MPPPHLPEAERHLLPVLRHGSPAILHGTAVCHQRCHFHGITVCHQRCHFHGITVCHQRRLILRRRLDAAAQPLLPSVGEARQPARNVPQRRLPLRSREALPPLAVAGSRVPPRQGLRERHLRHGGDEPGELRERAGAEHRPRGVGRAGEAAGGVLLEREDGVGDVGLRAAVGLGEGRGGAAEGLDVAAGDVGEGAERGGLRGGVAGGAEDLGGGDGGDRGLEAAGDARGLRRVTGALRRSPHTWRRLPKKRTRIADLQKLVCHAVVSEPEFRLAKGLLQMDQATRANSKKKKKRNGGGHKASTCIYEAVQRMFLKMACTLIPAIRARFHVNSKWQLQRAQSVI
ncbi:unnamed protein product [Urochloa decumbens]|uniref:Uncharacterized protein n=1 Tax=Urochloa decumbens TaxID=240449 RepID=A0ABC9CDK7_9POAL